MQNIPRTRTPIQQECFQIEGVMSSFDSGWTLRANFLLLFDCACRIHMERVLISPPDDSWFTTKTFHLEFRRYLVAFVYDTYTHNVKALHTPLSRCFAWIKHVRFLFLLFSLRVLLFYVLFLFCHGTFLQRRCRSLHRLWFIDYTNRFGFAAFDLTSIHLICAHRSRYHFPTQIYIVQRP